MQINKDIQKVTKQIQEKYKPEKIILFGSFARGENQKHSDIDLCIIKNTKVPFRERILKIYQIIRNLDYKNPIEPFVFTPREFEQRKDKYFFRNIKKEGKIIYEKSR